jgi:hypothetical protein
MKLCLKTIKQEIFSLEIPDDNLTVFELKQLIELEFNYDSTKLKLIYNGVILNDKKYLKEINIKDDCPIVLSNARHKNLHSDIDNSNIVQSNSLNEDNHGNLIMSEIKIDNCKEINKSGIDKSNDIINDNNPIANSHNIDDDEERIYQADIKAENAVKYIASIMKVLCIKSPEKGKEFFKNLEEDNPIIMDLIKKNDSEFKSYLYSPKTDEDQKIYKKFFKGKLNSRNLDEESDMENIKKLAEFGFLCEDAKTAYYACGKNFNSALNFLLEGNK